jgi:hypothetical protein
MELMVRLENFPILILVFGLCVTPARGQPSSPQPPGTTEFEITIYERRAYGCHSAKNCEYWHLDTYSSGPTLVRFQDEHLTGHGLLQYSYEDGRGTHNCILKGQVSKEFDISGQTYEGGKIWLETNLRDLKYAPSCLNITVEADFGPPLPVDDLHLIDGEYTVNPTKDVFQKIGIRLACPHGSSGGGITVEVRPTVSDPSLWPSKVENTLSMPEIRAKKHKRLEQTLRATTLAVPTLNMKPEYAGVPAKVGTGACVWVKQLTATFPTIVTYIPRNYSPNSCPYQTALVHEKKHSVDIATAYVSLSPAIRQELVNLNVPTRDKPMWAPSAEEGFQALENQLKDRTKPIEHTILERIENGRLKIDTREELLRVNSQCDREAWGDVDEELDPDI